MKERFGQEIRLFLMEIYEFTDKKTLELLFSKIDVDKLRVRFNTDFESSIKYMQELRKIYPKKLEENNESTES